MKRFLSLLTAFMLFASPALAVEPRTIELLTLQFGTASYASDMAMESLFKELKSPLTLLLKQTPGAMYINRYNTENKEKMRKGEVPFTMSLTTSAITMYSAKGLPPYQDYPQPDSRVIFGMNGMVMPFVTFNPDIKSPADFAGKKVGFAEKSRPNQSILPNQPVFDKAYGGFDKVDWQYLGFANSKDALLNGSIDVHMGSISGTFGTDEAGNIVLLKGTYDPALMEIVSANRPFYFVSEDPEVLKTVYDPNTDLVHFPVLIKAGTLPGYDKDFWVKGGLVVYALDKEVPDDVVEELVVTIFKNKARLADYYEGFSHMGDNPYPLGLDPAFIHPGLYKAMKTLGVPLPAGVTAPE